MIFSHRPCGLFVRFLLLLGVMSFPCLSEAVQLVVHPDVEQSTLNKDTVRALFTMRLRVWPDGMPVRVFVLADRNPVHREFSKRIIGVFPHQLRRAWDRMLFSGTGQVPTEVADEAAMVEAVAANPGAVGYVSDAVEDPRVRAIPLE